MDDISAITSTNNLTTGNNTPVSSDFKFYVPAPVTESDDQTMSFGDFLDMINPLQHIPLVSSAYRSITGDSISPVARITGDVIYGGILGVASAGLAAIGAIADEAFAANNDGNGVAGTIVASLFGSDKTSDTPQTQIADATPTDTAPALLSAPITTTNTTVTAAATTPPNAQAPILVNTPAASQQLVQKTDGGISLDRSKPAYGGAMDTSMIQNAQQNQSLALALAGNNGIVKAQHALAGSRFMTSNPIPGSTAATENAPPPNATQNMILQRAAAPLSPTPLSPTDPTAQPTAQTQTALQNMLKDFSSIKGLEQYRNAAQSTPAPGSTINTIN